MKVLLSAYACEPHRGSEPGVGWRWALEIASLGHETWVLTRRNNRQSIEAELARLSVENLYFVYFDLPSWVLSLKRIIGVQLYYLLWQFCSRRVAAELAEKVDFDRVHHLTFGVYRIPSWLSRIGREFVFGPVGGGEQAPWRLRRHFSWRANLSELIRDLANVLARLSPSVGRTLADADLILVKTPETAAKLASRYRGKVRCQLEIGIEPPAQLAQRQHSAAALRVLFVGRLLHWKGMGLGIRAFAELVAVMPDATLTLVGVGPERENWESLATSLKIADRVNWISRIAHQELLEGYSNFDVFLFPSLHDSSGNVVLEALSRGLPVVCLDLGGPAQIVDQRCGIAVPARSLSEDEVVQSLSAALRRIGSDRSFSADLKSNALERARQLTWRAAVVAAGY